MLFEQMADLETLDVTSDGSNAFTREKFNAAYQKLFPPIVPLGDISSSLDNKIWNRHEAFSRNYPETSNFTDEYQKKWLSSDLDWGNADQGDDSCNLITNEESLTYQNIAFYLELVVQPIFICIGFIFNTIAINVLRR